MLELCPDIDLNGVPFEGENGGWFTKETVETEEEMLERIKVLVRELKDMHKEHKDETVLLISHGWFLRTFMTFITNQHSEYKDLNSIKFLPRNLSLTILDFEDK